MRTLFLALFSIATQPIHAQTADFDNSGTVDFVDFLLFAQNFVPRPDYMLGYVHLPSFLAVVSGAVVAAPLGVRTAHRIQPHPLRRLFGVLLMLAALRMVYSAFW